LSTGIFSLISTNKHNELAKNLPDTNKHRAQARDKKNPLKYIEKWTDEPFLDASDEKTYGKNREIASLKSPVRGFLAHLCSKEGCCTK
jgi:hypothetical protein